MPGQAGFVHCLGLSTWLATYCPANSTQPGPHLEEVAQVYRLLSTVSMSLTSVSQQQMSGCSLTVRKVSKGSVSTHEALLALSGPLRISLTVHKVSKGPVSTRQALLALFGPFLRSLSQKPTSSNLDSHQNHHSPSAQDSHGQERMQRDSSVLKTADVMCDRSIRRCSEEGAMNSMGKVTGSVFTKDLQFA